MPGPAPRPGISTSTAPTWRTPGWPGSNAPLIDGRDWPDEVESPAGRRQPRHLEGQRAAAPARRARHGELLCCVGDPVTAGARKSAALSRGVPPDELLATRPSATMILIHELPGVCKGLPATTSASSRPCTPLSIATRCGGRPARVALQAFRLAAETFRDRPRRGRTS